MFKKIKKYYEMRKLKKDSMTLLIVNSAEVVTSLKNFLNLLENMTATTLDTVSKEDIDLAKKFMDEFVANPDIKQDMFRKIYDDSQALRDVK